MTFRQKMLQRAFHYRPGRVAINTFQGSAWLLVKAVSHVLILIIVARVLGPEDYGTLTAIGGIAIVLSTLSGLGAGALMLQFVSLNPLRFGYYWSASMRLSIMSGFTISLLFLVVVPHFLTTNTGFLSIASIAISEILMLPMVHVCSAAFHARERLGWAAGLQAFMALTRLVGTILFYAAGSHTVESYCLFHAGASIVAAGASVFFTVLLLKPPLAKGFYTLPELSLGVRFCISGITSTGFSESDKLITYRILDAHSAGTYTVASRILSVIALPITALAQAIYPRLVLVANGKSDELPRIIKPVAVACLAYAPVAFFLIFLAHRYLGDVLGKSFQESAETLLYLAPLLVLLCLRTLVANLLSAFNHPGRRAAMEAVAGIILIVSGFLLIPQMGLNGTIIAVLLSECCLIIGLTVLASRGMPR